MDNVDKSVDNLKNGEFYMCKTLSSTEQQAGVDFVEKCHQNVFCKEQEMWKRRGFICCRCFLNMGLLLFMPGDLP